MIVGYTRPLFKGDDATADADALGAAGAEQIVTERDYRSRVHLAMAIAEARGGDTIMVTSLERLGTSISAVVSTLLELRARDVNFVCLATPELNAADDDGSVLATLAALHAVHRAEISRRTKAGMVGRPAGRPRALTPEAVGIAVELRRAGRSYARVGEVLGVSATAVQTALRESHDDL